MKKVLFTALLCAAILGHASTKEELRAVEDKIRQLKEESASRLREAVVAQNQKELDVLLREQDLIRENVIRELKHFSSVGALLILGEQYMEQAERKSLDNPDYSHAIEVFERVVREFPHLSSLDAVYYLLGICYVSSDRNHDAIAIWKKLIAEFPNSKLRDETLFRLADEYFADRKWDEAMAAYKPLVENPNSPFYGKAVYKLAWADYLENRYDEAIAGFVKVLNQPSSSSLKAEAEQYIALSFSDKDSDNAVALLKNYFAETHPIYERAIFIKLADVLSKLARFDEASQALDYAISLEPANVENPELALQSVKYIADSASVDVAMKAREQLIAKYPNAKALIREPLRLVMNYEHVRAREEQSIERYQKAAQYYAQYVRDFPAESDVTLVLYYIGETAFQGQWFADAARAFEQVRDWPQKIEHQKQAALDVVFARRAEIERLQKLGEIPQFDLTSIKPENKASLSGEIPPALQLYVKAVDVLRERNPDIAEVPAFLFEVAGIYYDYGDWAQAEKRFSEIVDAYPTLPIAKFSADLLLHQQLAQNDWAAVARDAARFKQANVNGATQEFQSIEMSARFKQAQASFDAGNYDVAAEQYLALLKDDPKSEYGDKMLFNAAIALDLAKHHAKAEVVLDRLIAEYPQSAFAEKSLLQRARRFEERLELEQAAKSYIKFSHLYPKSEHATDALTNAALLEEALQHFQKSAQMFEKLGTADGILRAAKLYAKAREPNERKRVLTQFIKKYRHDVLQIPAVIQADVELGDLQDAVNLFAKHGDSPVGAYYASKAQYLLLDDELKQFDKLKINSKSGKVQGEQLKAKTLQLSTLKKKYEAVVLKYGLSEWTVASLYQIGGLYENLFKSMLSAPCPADVEKIDEDACDEYKSLLEDKAMVIEDKAIESFKLAKDKSKESPDATEWGFVAEDALHRLKPSDYPMSLRPLSKNILLDDVSPDLQENARKLLDVNPKDMDARLSIAKLFMSEGKYEAAKMVLEDSIEIDDNHATTHEWLGYVLRAEHDVIGAIAELEKALSLDNQLAVAKDSLGVLLISRGELERAGQLLDDSLRALPKSSLVHLHLGNVDLLSGRTTEAVSRYDEAISLNSEDIDAYYNLGLANMVLEKFEIAQENWLKYIEKSNDEGAKKRAESYLTIVNRKVQIENQRRAREKEVSHEVPAESNATHAE